METEIQDREGLGRFGREHHVHYDVEPEVVIEGEHREVVGFDVRLFATYGESKLATPACPRCVELSNELRSFAEHLVSPGDAASWTEIVPAEPVLYQSAEEPDAEEVALTLRVRCDSSDERRGTGEDRRLVEMKERLDAVG